MATCVQRHPNVRKQTTLLDGIDVGPPKWCTCGRGLNKSFHEGLDHISFKDSQCKYTYMCYNHQNTVQPLYNAMFGVHRKGPHVISELCYKGTILQRNYRKMTIKTILQRNYQKMTILWSFSYNFFVKFYGRKIWEPQHDHVISKSML